MVFAAAASEPVPGPLRPMSGAEERHMCVFCHVLDGGLAAVQGPSWEPSLEGPYAFPPFPGADRTIASVSTDGSRSVVCLACHDTGQGPGQGTFETGHPFAVPYRGVPVDERLIELARGPEYAWRRSARVIGAMSFKPARRDMVGGATVWRVPAYGGAEELPLFTRSDAAWSEVPFIECTTCHDPHSKNRLFLRVVNEDSRLCLSCHNI